MPNARSKEIFLVLGFLAIVATPGILQTVLELRRGESVQALAVFRQRPTAKCLREYERELEESSWVARQLRPWMQFAQFRVLKEAGDKALIGRDGWLFYRPGVRYLTERRAAPQLGEPPRQALRAANGQHGVANARVVGARQPADAFECAGSRKLGNREPDAREAPQSGLRNGSRSRFARQERGHSEGGCRAT